MKQIEVDTPHDCWTCRYRREVEYGPALAVGIREQQCSAFVRSDRFGNTTPMTCLGAYDRFCGGSHYRPDLWTRVLRALRIV